MVYINQQFSLTKCPHDQKDEQENGLELWEKGIYWENRSRYANRSIVDPGYATPEYPTNRGKPRWKYPMAEGNILPNPQSGGSIHDIL